MIAVFRWACWGTFGRLFNFRQKKHYRVDPIRDNFVAAILAPHLVGSRHCDSGSRIRLTYLLLCGEYVYCGGLPFIITSRLFVI